MRLILRLIAPSLLLFACALPCPAQSAATPQPPQSEQQGRSPAALDLGEWKEFAPAGGGFSILFPGTPQSTTQTLRLIPEHSAEHHIHGLTNPTLECSVIYADYPVPAGDPAAARGVLDSGVSGAASTVNAALLSVTEITHEGHPGRLLRQRLLDGGILRVKMVLVGQRLYRIAFTTPRPEGASAATVRHYEETAAKFIDSFKLAAAKPTKILGPSGPIGPPQGAPDDAVAVTLEAAQPGEVDQYLADHPRQVYGGRVEDGSGLLPPADEGRLRQGTVISKPPPPYPAVAKAARARGPVVVWVVVDEEGKVVAAQAHSGHPLLRASAVKAAREARFTPTLVDGKPVKVAGVITYNFNLR